MNLDKFKNVEFLLCIKTHTYKASLGEHEYLAGRKYKCILENKILGFDINYLMLSVYFPDGSGSHSLLIESEDTIEYFTEHFTLITEHRNKIINELL